MTQAASDLVERDLPAGPVVGRVGADVLEFRGIPYGEAPTGPRRFRPPVRKARWSEPLACVDHRPIVPQPWDILDELLDTPRLPWSEEDALQLTVSVPAGARPGDDLPVMVWIHGGSLTTGSCTWPMYDGTAFARDGVVFVGVNYRLHALGFLDLRDVLGEPDSVNLGLQDVVLGLEWVQENIAALGGDPGSVTIFGESVGGALVGALTALERGPSLFRRAILQSGANTQLIEPEESRALASSFLSVVGVAPGDRAALEQLPVEAIVDACQDPSLLEDAERLVVPWNLTREPHLLPRTGLDAAESGDLVGIDLMLGWTLDEGRLEWLAEPPAPGPGPVDRVSPEALDHLDRVYAANRPDLDDAERRMAISSDQAFAIPAVRIAEAQAARNGRAYLYEFRWPSPVLDGRLGSCHALEIPFVFDQWVSPTFTGSDRPAALVEHMHRSWLAFARTGCPDPDADERTSPWRTYDTDGRAVMVFDETSRVEHDPRSAERRAWDDVPTTDIGII